jgi:hypothetical protein
MVEMVEMVEMVDVSLSPVSVDKNYNKVGAGAVPAHLAQDIV